LLVRFPDGRLGAAGLLGIVAAVTGLSVVRVLNRGVVIAVLPATLERVATTLAIFAGAAAALLVVLAPVVGERRARRPGL